MIFDQRFRGPSAPVAPSADPASIDAYINQMGGSSRYFVDPHNTMIDDYLGQVLSSLHNGFTDPLLQQRASQEGLTDSRWIQDVLNTRNNLRSGDTNAVLVNGQLQMVNRGTALPAGAQSFTHPQSPGLPPGTPSAGPGTSGYTTADMIRDPYTGELLSRPSYNQRYGVAPKPASTPNGMGVGLPKAPTSPASGGRYLAPANTGGRTASGPRPNPQPYGTVTTGGPGPFRSFGG